MSDSITWNPGAVGDQAHGVITTAGQLDQIHADATSKTTALNEFFGGHGATGFFEAQAQMLQGLSGLVETIGHHGTTIGSSVESAVSTDQAINSIF